jgi:hypothetical protein
MSYFRTVLITAFFLITCTVFLNQDPALGATVAVYARPLPVDPEFKPRSGIYYYTVAFNEVRIGTASMAIDNGSDQYKVQVHAQTTGMVDHIYRLRYQGEAIMGIDPVSPLTIKMQQDVRSTEKITSISFQNNGAIKTTETESKNGNTADYTVRNVQTEKFTVDPFSASYLVRGLDWEVGTEKVFNVYPGKYQYELKLKCIGRETIDIAGEKRDAWVIVPQVTNLDPEKRAEAAKKKQANIKIYVSADGLRDVLKIEASHTLGQFLARLDRFEPAPNPPKVVENTPNKAPSIPIKTADVSE